MPGQLALTAGCAFLGIGIDQKRLRVGRDGLVVHHDFADIVQPRQLEHGIQQDVFHDGPQPARAGLANDRALGDGAQRFIGEGQVGPFDVEQLLVLAHQRVLRFCQDGDKRVLVQIGQRCGDGQTADEFRDQPEFQQVFGLQRLQPVPDCRLVFHP